MHWFSGVFCLARDTSRGDEAKHFCGFCYPQMCFIAAEQTISFIHADLRRVLRDHVRVHNGKPGSVYETVRGEWLSIFCSHLLYFWRGIFWVSDHLWSWATRLAGHQNYQGWMYWNRLLSGPGQHLSASDDASALDDRNG